MILELQLGHTTWVWMDELALRVDLFDMLPRMTTVVSVTVYCWGSGRVESTCQLILSYGGVVAGKAASSDGSRTSTAA